MTYTKTLILSFALSFWTTCIFAQAEHGYLIKINNDVESFLRDFTSNNSVYRDIETPTVVSEAFGILHVSADAPVSKIAGHRHVEFVEPNVRLSPRRTPNDQFFDLQWNMQKAGFADLWSLTTGGKNTLGDEIVVAVIDEGFDIAHEDIVDNIFINTKEVPNDGIDNDNNGYVDDYNGYNAQDQKGGVAKSLHGTQVIGIVGAKGNNRKGVSGTNWNVKMIPISADDLIIRDILHGYDYAYNMRKKYNETNGKEGAFIVATNLSLGYKSSAENNRTWCSVYDKLGSVGILNIGAGPNAALDIDEDPDLPADCPSEYIVAVTNTDKNDKLYKRAGWGATKMDLAAPGQQSYTISTDNKYNTFGGTSASTPHVAGAVALLHSVPCESLAEQSMKDPSASALKMKEIILSGVDPLAELKDKTVSGGRLNVLKAAQKLQSLCPDILGPSKKGALKIENIRKSNTTLFVDYISPNEDIVTMTIMDAMGRVISRASFEPPLFGVKTRSFSTSSMRDGVYIIIINQGSDRHLEKYIFTRK